MSYGGTTQAAWGFHNQWCSWKNQCGGATWGTVYWLIDQQCGVASCSTPGTANDNNCMTTPGNCEGQTNPPNPHCYDSDALWNVPYVENYEGTWNCDGVTGTLTYWGPGCTYRP
jgi:hypothetical protein